MANKLSKPNKSKITTLLLPKMIKNRSNLYEMGGHYLVAALYLFQKSVLFIQGVSLVDGYFELG